jgi:hypothetical protein
MVLREFTIPRNPGFYESILSYSDEFIDHESEDKDFIIDKYNITDKNFEVQYVYDDYNKFMDNVLNALGEKIIDDIESDFLPYDSIEYISTDRSSPAYYNYSTDRGFGLINIEGYILEKLKNIAFNDYYDESNEYLLDNFSSGYGYHSFYPNDIDIWKKKSIYKYDYNELGTILGILHGINQDDESWMYEIAEISSEIKWKHVSLNEFYFNGKYMDYKEFCKQLNVDRLEL